MTNLPNLDGMALTQQRKNDLMYFDGVEWRRLPTGTAGQVLTVGPDGAPGWDDLPSNEPPTVIGGLLAENYVVKMADESVTNSIVLQADNELLFAIAANEVWLIEGWVIATGPEAADFKWDMAIPAGAVGSKWFAVLDAGGLVDVQQDDSLTSDVTVRIDATNGLVFPFIARITNASTAGNVVFQWAQNTASATPTIVKAGSFLRTLRVA